MAETTTSRAAEAEKRVGVRREVWNAHAAAMIGGSIPHRRGKSKRFPSPTKSPIQVGFLLRISVSNREVFRSVRREEVRREEAIAHAAEIRLGFWRYAAAEAEAP
uniref:Uncharacterized protein n=1 Tax=Arundo donax TaxID=35708 RepID=A0A0A8XT40_ARUDO